MLPAGEQNFNTSHVVVYRNRSYKKGLYFLNFNTSHVVVYHHLVLNGELNSIYFNTSHVVVYQKDGRN